MNKLICAILGMTLMGGVYAQAQTISSRNAVGYVKFVAKPGELAYISNPFVSISGPSTLEDLISDEVPAGSQILRWNENSQIYDVVTKVGPSTWFPDDGTPLTRGVGYFVSVHSSAVEDAEIYLYGEVPGASSFSTETMNLVPGINALGYPYPSAVTIENSGLDAATSPGDAIFLWSTESQNYASVTKVGPNSWFPANQVIQPGQGFLVSKSAGGTYVETVPYSWPNN